MLNKEFIPQPRLSTLLLHSPATKDPFQIPPLNTVHVFIYIHLL